MNFVAKTLVAASLVAGFASAASAVTIIPISAAASSATSGYPGADAIDGNPLTDWAAGNTGAGSNILFDLGGSYALTGGSVTDRVTSGGPNGVFVGGLFDFTTVYELTFYSDAAGTVSVGTYTSPTLVGPVGATLPSDFLTSPTFSFTASSVRYTVIATAGSNPGLSEISFEGTPSGGVVPEASTWLLMVAGFGMVGIAARRRKVVIAA
jgi:hypothetical protein